MHGRARAGAQPAGAGRVVRVRVRAEDALDDAAGDLQHAREVLGVVHARIDHDRPFATHHVRIGARPGQRTRIRRHDAPGRGPDLLDGVYMGAQYWHQVHNPCNDELVKRVREVYGINPNYPLAADYAGTKIILDAIAKAGSAEDGRAVAKAMEGMVYEGPTGLETVRAADHQVIKDYYLLRGKAKSKMKDADDLAEVVSSGKSFPEGDAIMCKMA